MISLYPDREALARSVEAQKTERKRLAQEIVTLVESVESEKQRGMELLSEVSFIFLLFPRLFIHNG